MMQHSRIHQQTERGEKGESDSGIHWKEFARFPPSPLHLFEKQIDIEGFENSCLSFNLIAASFLGWRHTEVIIDILGHHPADLNSKSTQCVVQIHVSGA